VLNRAPLVPLRLFRIRSLRISTIALALNGAAFLAMFFLTAIFLQQVRGLSALSTGLELLPMGAAAVLAAVVSSLLVTRIGTRRVQIGGAVLSIVGLFLLSHAAADSSYAASLLPGLLVYGVGILGIVPAQISAIAEVTTQDAGAASGIVTAGYQVGGALGLAVITTIAIRASRTSWRPVRPRLRRSRQGSSGAWWWRRCSQRSTCSCRFSRPTWSLMRSWWRRRRSGHRDRDCDRSRKLSAVAIDVESDLRAPPLSRWELATGYALGGEGGPEPPAHRGGHTDPRAALEAAMRAPLTRTPCVVSFSGGRDSSAVLAVATAAARREGLPDPVPVTLRFPGVASTDESRWQELVVAHLGLRDWERIELGDELDLLGPVARAALLTHGLLWPPNSYFHVPILERAVGGALLTGLDGDGLLGGWRWHRTQAVLSRRVRPEARDPARVALALSPPRVRQRWMRPSVLRVVPWIRTGARPKLEALVRTDAAREPRRWDQRIAYYRRRRYLALTARSLELLCATRRVAVSHPLLAPEFLSALARDGAAPGYGGRTSSMLALFGDVLPRELLTRRGKGEFGRALWKREARAFADAWDGRGVDTELVDPDRLREAWKAENPVFGTGTLLHEAWLAAQPK
jgi:hypothetical protein